MMNGCHLCGGPLFSEPILVLERIPRAAQYFPARESFAEDEGIDLRVSQCSRCGLVQLPSEPVDYFREVITAASLSERARASRLRQMRDFVARFDLTGKRVLEVGCGTGGMLPVLQEAGLSATGMEASEASAAQGAALGRKIVHGYIGDGGTIPGAPFDAFVCLNYLEHLPRPSRILQHIQDLTADRSAGFVTVPNFEYLLETRCFYEFVPDHLSYFTPRTLTFAFEQSGFEVVECTTINNDNDIAVWVRKRRPLDLKEDFAEVERLQAELRRMVAENRSRGKRVAVWGAGHRTLTLLALSRPEGIAYVVDSAAFKQGRFTPVLHLPIVAPETLHADPVDLVIVMVPGIYPEEVLTTLERMHTGAEVAVLQGNRIVFPPSSVVRTP